MRRIVVGLLTGITTFATLTLPVAPAAAAAPRYFPADSYWNKMVPVDAPVHPSSQAMIDWLKADNGNDYLTLAGTSSTGAWGQPMFWAEPGDPTYDVVQTRYKLPPEFDNLRIPPEARPDPTVDAEFTIFDPAAGIMSTLHRAQYDPATDTWSAGGASVYYMNSNGIEGKLPQSNEPRNFGHRGLPPSTYAVRWDEIQAGSIDHVLKIAVNTTKAESVYPMSGHENGTTAAFAPPEGTRIRIKPSVNVEALSLSPAAKVIARALQRYGAVIGDQSGGNPVLKVENTVAEGRGNLWSGVLNGSSLAGIPLDKFEVLELGYEPNEILAGWEAPAVPKVKVVKPKSKFIRVGKRVRVLWRTANAETSFARLTYKVSGGPTKKIRGKTADDGKFVWKPPRKLRGKRIHVKVRTLSVDGYWGGARSRWYKTR